MTTTTRAPASTEPARPTAVPSRSPFGFGAAMPPQKAKNFKSSARRLFARLAPERSRVIAVLAFAIAGVTLSVLGPLVMREATRAIIAGFFGQKFPATMSASQVIASLHASGHDRMADMLMASLLLASRPVRWARAFSRVAAALGGRPAARIEVGGRPALRVRRNTIDVSVRIVRRLGPGDPGRLRTVISAHRVGSGGETLSLISEGLPRAAWPPPADPSTGTLYIDRRAAALLDAARPSSTTVRSHDVEIAFDGALADHDRMGAAIELAAWWACESHGQGPYR